MGDTGQITANVVDPSNCEPLWSMDSGVGGVVTVNTSLVQYCDTQLNGVAKSTTPPSCSPSAGADGRLVFQRGPLSVGSGIQYPGRYSR